MKKNLGYSFAADVVRFLAIIGVVTIHTVNAVYARPDFFGGTTWWLATILNSLARSAIPFFILLSGYLLLPKQENFLQMTKRTFTRIFIPLIIWFIVYNIWNVGYPSLKNINISLLHRLWSGNVFHLYFLVIMLGLYVSAPFLNAIVHKVSLKKLPLLLILLFFAGGAIIFEEYLTQTCDESNLLTMWIPFLGFFVAGFFFTQFKPKRRHIFFSSALCFVMIGLTITLNFISATTSHFGPLLLQPSGCLSTYFDHYLSPNVAIMSLTAFMVLIHLNYAWLLKKPLMVKIIQMISHLTFGIFLIHLLIIDLIDVQLHLGIDFVNIPLWAYLIVKIVGVLFISSIVVWLGYKLPVVKIVFGGK